MNVLADRLRFLRLLSEIPAAGGEKAAFVAVVAALKEVVDGHHYSAFYGRIGLPCVDVFLPGEGWLGVDSDLAKLIAQHHHEHPFCRDFFFSDRPVAYLRSQMMPDADWHRTSMYRNVDRDYGVVDMIGLYYPMPTGQFGAVFCGAKRHFTAAEFSAVKDFHAVVMPLLEKVPEYPLGPQSDAVTAGGLTLREGKVMDWVARGKSNGEIAIILGISQHTVRKHLENILAKLGVENRTAAALTWKRPGGSHGSRV